MDYKFIIGCSKSFETHHAVYELSTIGFRTLTSQSALKCGDKFDGGRASNSICATRVSEKPNAKDMCGESRGSHRFAPWALLRFRRLPGAEIYYDEDTL